MTITLAELRLQSRQRADMVNSTFVSNSELTSYINSSIAELRDLLCEAYGEDYFVTEYEFTTDGSASYPLPANFYELKAVDLKADTQNWINVQRFNFNERNRLNNSEVVAWGGVNNVKYRLVGTNIKLAPVPPSGTDMRLWYVPLPTALVNDNDTLQDFNSYSEYVIVDAAIKMMQKEESDVTVLMLQKQALAKRISDKAANRDATYPESVSDIHAEDLDYWGRPR